MAPGSGYSREMRAFHWTSVVLLVLVYALAVSVEDAASAGQARLLLTLHRSAGATLFMLTLARLWWRMRSAIPPLPSDLPRWQTLAARANAGALYLLLLMQPLLGLCASWLHGDRLVLYGLLLPSPLPIDRPLSRRVFELHHDVGWLLLVLITMHVGAALFHHFVRRDDVLRGMVRDGARTDLDAAIETCG